MTQHNNTPTPSPQPLASGPHTPTPTPAVGMVIKIIHYVDDNGLVVKSGPWTIAAVSANGRTVWTRGGQQINLDSPAEDVRFYWPDDLRRDPEPIVTFPAAAETQKAAT